MMEDITHKYLRPNKTFPHVWCIGCGNGIILDATIRAIDVLGLKKNKVVFVSGIGCSSRAPVYVDFPALHGTHGRALAFATGIKHANPDLTVIVVTGDGDALAIGGNHFIHACRRNIDITAIVYNNNIYGMTGGQASPTMELGEFGATAPYGRIERPFNVCNLATAAGANFVARGTVYHSFLLEKLIRKGIEKKGFSVIDAVTTCPTIYNFYNKTGSPAKMMNSIKENTIPLTRVQNADGMDLKNKIITGQKHYGEAYISSQ